MIGDLVIKTIIHHCVGDVHSLGEDLVQVAPQFVGDGSWVHCAFKSHAMHLLVHVVYVVVEISTDHHCRICILLDDISHDICHTLCSVFLELLLTWFQIAVDYLHFVSPSCQPHPTEVCPQRLHKCHI